jgi:hypothetical protein
MDSFTVMSIAIGLGAAFGALAAFLGWNRTGEAFDVKKFISGLATGIISGIAVVLANQAGIINAASDATQTLIILVTIGLSILGVDTIRTSITSAIRKPDPTP